MTTCSASPPCLTVAVHMAERGALERPSVQLKVIRDLAGGGKPAALARKYGVTVQAMTQFRDRHSMRIAEVREHLDDAYAGIEFASKGARVAALSQQAAEILELLASPDRSGREGVQYAEMARTSQSALRAIAEELGQLPSRHTVQVGGSLDVQINGVDVSALT